MSLLSKVIQSIKAKNAAGKVLEPSFPPAEYSPAITTKKGLRGGIVGAGLSFLIIGGIARARGEYPSLLWWPPEQDTEATAAILGVLAGVWMAGRNWLKNITIWVLCCAVALGALSGCTTRLGAGGLTITTDASAAATMAPTVLSVSRSIADIMAKLAAEKDMREQEALAVKLAAQQQRLQTILQFVGSATGANK